MIDAKTEAEVVRLKAGNGYRSEVARCAGQVAPSVAEPAPEVDLAITAAVREALRAERIEARETICRRYDDRPHPFIRNLIDRSRAEDWTAERLSSALKPYV